MEGAVVPGYRPVRKLGSRIAARFRKVGLDAEIPELRGQAPRLPDFDE